MDAKNLKDLNEMAALVTATSKQISGLVEASVQRNEQCLDRIDMMADVLEQTVSLLKIKGTMQDRDFITIVTNMVATCRKFTADQRKVNEGQIAMARQL